MVLPPLSAAVPGNHSTRMVEYSHEDIRTAPGASAGGRRRPQYGPNTAFCLPSHRGVNPHQGPCAASSLLSSHGPSVALAGFTRTYSVLVQLLLLKMGVSTCRLYPALEPRKWSLHWPAGPRRNHRAPPYRHAHRLSPTARYLLAKGSVLVRGR